MWDRNPIQAATQTDEIFQVPKDTTPTWEVELLLSGALVFSMTQVPGLLDDAIYALRPRLTGSLNFGAFMLYFYLKITSYALIATFALHLFQRAIWVAGLGQDTTTVPAQRRTMLRCTCPHTTSSTLGAVRTTASSASASR